MRCHKPDWENLLREILNKAVLIDDGDDSGHFWEICLTAERMQEFENMGLWNKEAT
tara:strand:- start:538 stop:705 length:168 start_codon:yes stop_codon:yes gene_type:complete